MSRTRSRAVPLAVGGALAASAVVGAVVLIGPSAGATARPVARAVLHDTTGHKVGSVLFVGRGRHAERVEVHLDAGSIPAPGSFHGFHVHAVGSCDPNPSGSTNVPFGSAGGHWAEPGQTHGHHTGDLPSLLVQEDGTAVASFDTDRFDVDELVDAAGDGSAVIVHAGADNFANIPAAYGPVLPATLSTGDAGARFACGVVGAP